MTDDYIYVTGQDGEVYEVRPTDGLLSFLQRLADREEEEQARDAHKCLLALNEVTCSPL